MIEKEFTYAGLHCMIRFVPLGHRCGYVRIPKEIPHRLIDEAVVHGGITYDGPNPLDYNGSERWIGFDCGHWNDRPDFDALEKYRMQSTWSAELQESLKYPDAVSELLAGMTNLWTLDMVEDELKDLADQVVQWCEEMEE